MAKEIRGQRGQSIVIVALLMLALVALVALAVDGGRLYYFRRQMQDPSDAGALAGALETCREGPNSQKSLRANAEAREFARRNQAIDPIGVDVDLVDRTVEVTTHVTFPAFFAGLVGFPELGAGAFAEAQAECGGGKYAVWAHSDRCEATIDWSGSNLEVTGDVHSNNDLKMGGSDNTIDGTTEYVSSTDISGSGNDISLQKVPYDPNWPVSFEIADFAPGGAAAVAAGADYHYHEGLFEADDQGQHLHGLYYVTGDIKLDKSDLWGQVTFVTPGQILVAG